MEGSPKDVVSKDVVSKTGITRGSLLATDRMRQVSIVAKDLLKCREMRRFSVLLVGRAAPRARKPERPTATSAR
jgi:hypothetical protein